MKEVTPQEIEALHDEFGDRPHPPPPHRERRGLAWLIVAPWCVAAVLRLLPFDTFHPAVSAYALMPFVAMTAVIPLAIALFFRVRPAAIAAAAALVAFAFVFAGRALPGPQPESANGRVVTVMTFNALVGGAEPKAVIDTVRKYRVDVLALQELTPTLAEVLREDGLADELPYSLEDLRTGPFGGGVWSRNPIIRTYKETSRREAESPEGFVHELGLRVRSVHPIPPTSGERVRRWKRTLAAMPDAATTDGSLRILAGDFNATLDHSDLRDVIDRGYADAADTTGQGLVTTWPATARFAIVLDHVLVDKRIRVTQVKILRMPGSDHRAVIVRMRLP